MDTETQFVPQDPTFKIEKRQVAGRTVLVTVRGELDVCHAEEFQRVIEETLVPEATTIINLDVKYVDSEGLKALIIGRREAIERQARLILVCSPRALKIMSVTHLEGVFHISESVEQAIAQAT